MLYINNSVNGQYLEIDYTLTEEKGYEMGTTYEDYLQGKWIELSEGQKLFHEQNPGASIREVINTELDPEPPGPTPEQLLAQAKNRKNEECSSYAYSDAVRKIVLDDQSVWLEKWARQDYRTRIETAKRIGSNIVVFNGSPMEANVLAVLLDYMDSHELKLEEVLAAKMKEVSECTDVEQVEDIDAQSGYPEIIVKTYDDLKSESKAIDSNDSQIAAATFLLAIINTPETLAQTPANLALKVKALYPIWDKDDVYGDRGIKMGTAVVKGQRIRHKVKEDDAEFTLFEVRSDHTLQATWVPGQGGGSESLYEAVQETHSGTIDDPIPWVYNMTLENGKYYIDKGVKYICERDSVNPMPYENLSDLVEGGYVKVVD